jgi:hypothetical protein
MKTYERSCIYRTRNSVSQSSKDHFPVHRPYLPGEGSNSTPFPMGLSDNLPVSPDLIFIQRPDDEGRILLWNICLPIRHGAATQETPIWTVTDVKTSKRITRYVFIGSKIVFNKYFRSRLLSYRYSPYAFCWTVKSGLSKHVRKYPLVFLYECPDWSVLYNGQGICIHSGSDFHSMHLTKLK